MERAGRPDRAVPDGAIRLQWLWLAFLTTAVVLVYLVTGSSQTMKAAWAEDLLSFVPPSAFLFAVRMSTRAPTEQHPCGFHRSVGIGHPVHLRQRPARRVPQPAQRRPRVDGCAGHHLRQP